MSTINKKNEMHEIFMYNNVWRIMYYGCIMRLKMYIQHCQQKCKKIFILPNFYFTWHF